MAILGIDLGTTNSLAAVWRNGRSELIPNAAGGYLTPSVVSVDEDGSVLVGQTAKDRLISHPDRTAARFKRYMGTQKTFQLGDRVFRPEELSALVLRRLREEQRANVFSSHNFIEDFRIATVGDPQVASGAGSQCRGVEFTGHASDGEFRIIGPHGVVHNFSGNFRDNADAFAEYAVLAAPQSGFSS